MLRLRHRRQRPPELVECGRRTGGVPTPRAATGRRGAARRSGRPRPSAPGSRGRALRPRRRGRGGCGRAAGGEGRPPRGPARRGPARRLLERRRRPAVEERRSVGGLDHVGADLLLLAEEEQVEDLQRIHNRIFAIGGLLSLRAARCNHARAARARASVRLRRSTVPTHAAAHGRPPDPLPRPRRRRAACLAAAARELQRSPDPARDLAARSRHVRPRERANLGRPARPRPALR